MSARVALGHGRSSPDGSSADPGRTVQHLRDGLGPARASAHTSGDPADAWPHRRARADPGPGRLLRDASPLLVLPVIAATACCSLPHRRDRHVVPGAHAGRARRDLRALRVGATSRPPDPRPRRRPPRRRRVETVRDRDRPDPDRQDHRLRDPRDPRMARPGRRDLDQDRPPPRDDRSAAPRSPARARSSTTRPGAPACRARLDTADRVRSPGRAPSASPSGSSAPPSTSAAGIERRADFWYGATAKLLAPILLAAACSGGTMAQVVAWVDSQETDHVRRRARRERRRGGTQRRSRRSRSGTTEPAAASTRPPRRSSSPTPTPASSPPP